MFTNTNTKTNTVRLRQMSFGGQAPLPSLDSYYQHLRHDAAASLKRGCRKLQNSSICYNPAQKTMTGNNQKK